MAEVLIALGGNVGDVRATLDRAVELLCDGNDIRLIARSSDYRTPPWGKTDQPEFVNLCIVAQTSLSPHALLERAQLVERALGRDRSKDVRWGPRPIDIDLLAYDQIEIDEPNLQLPHPRLLERGFVLVPLAEIAPDRVVSGTKIGDAVKRVDTSGITVLPPRLSHLI
jgi:2-amino-4-hydroxy-6-hydroxymethyldihydropteridine diphosphokinase